VPDTSDNKVGSVTLMLDPNTDLPVTGAGYTSANERGVHRWWRIRRDGAYRGAGCRRSIGVAPTASPRRSRSTIPAAATSRRRRSVLRVVARAQSRWRTWCATNGLTGHVDPRLIMDVGVMNGNIPAPMIAIDEDDELFLTLTNVGMVMRPDLFEQHTVHFHGYPNASAFYDGVPDASVAINIGGSFTYYYLAPEAGTYMWHCHISPPEHLQMGMVGQLYVRPRQNAGTDRLALRRSLQADQARSEPQVQQRPTSCARCSCRRPTRWRASRQEIRLRRRRRLDAYDVEYPIQMHGFDPNFHFVGMTFNPESFADTKDKYFLLNGRSYPDTIHAGPMQHAVDGRHGALLAAAPTVINIPAGWQGAAALLGPERHRVPHAGLARHSHARGRPQRAPAA
jgi:FtsP/CotA-like multicopper oxidase with cupredoxin domain